MYSLFGQQMLRPLKSEITQKLCFTHIKYFAKHFHIYHLISSYLACKYSLFRKHESCQNTYLQHSRTLNFLIKNTHVSFFHVESNSGKRMGFLASYLLLSMHQICEVHRGADEGLGGTAWLSWHIVSIPGGQHVQQLPTACLVQQKERYKAYVTHYHIHYTA